MSDRIDEKSPPGWSGTTRAMKKNHPEIDNPYALAWSVKNKGEKHHYKPMPDADSRHGTPKKYGEYKDKDKPKRKKFSEWLEDREYVFVHKRATNILPMASKNPAN